MSVTREEWLKAAVALVNKHVFNSEYEVSQLQISIGRPKGKALGETVVTDFNKEDLSIDDLFPPTVFISPLIKEPIQILIAITHELIHAYETMSPRHSKAFKQKAEEVGFIDKKTDYQIDGALETTLNGVLDLLVSQYGKWPGVAIAAPTKKESDEKTKKTNIIVYFCPECGFELKTSKKSAEEHPGSPTCVCGCKMGIDYGEEPNNEQSEK